MTGHLRVNLSSVRVPCDKVLEPYGHALAYYDLQEVLLDVVSN